MLGIKTRSRFSFCVVNDGNAGFGGELNPSESIHTAGNALIEGDLEVGGSIGIGTDKRGGTAKAVVLYKGKEYTSYKRAHEFDMCLPLTETQLNKLTATAVKEAYVKAFS